MDLALPIDEAPLALTAVYKDRKGNATTAPAGAGPLAWTDSNPATAAIDNTTGTTVNLSPGTGTVGDTTAINVGDGTLTSTDPLNVTLAPGVAASLAISVAPLT